MRTAEQAELIARKIVEMKFSSAQVAFCAGSIIRGEGTETSDIDLVVVFPQLKQAWRESFMFEGWPVEAFVHDPSTLKYFFSEVDGKSGVPSLPQMVAEGLVVWGDEVIAQKFKDEAKQLIQAGPEPLTSDDIRNRLYGLLDLVDDLKSPRSQTEAIGTACRLYEALGDFALRSQNYWSGDGKQISRAMKRRSLSLHDEFTTAFNTFFKHFDPALILAFANKITKQFGGLVFDGYMRGAPEAWRNTNGPVLKTDRLTLRFALEKDVVEIIRYFKNNEKHFASTDPAKPSGFLTEEYWKNRISQDRENFLTDRAIRFYLFEHPNDSELIGTVTFSQISRGPLQACYLGYGISHTHEGRGLMSEALRAAIDFTFKELNIHRIMANHLPENIRSATLLHRLGFQKEGVAKDYLFINGQWRDHALNSLTNINWKRSALRFT